MKELKDKFYKNCLFLVQNFKDASERDIEQQVNDVANMPIFKDIDQKTVLETIKRIEHVEGVTMSSATCLSDDKNIKDWLTNERKAECRKNNSIKYSEDYSVYLSQCESFPSEVISITPFTKPSYFIFVSKIFSILAPSNLMPILSVNFETKKGSKKSTFSRLKRFGTNRVIHADHK